MSGTEPTEHSEGCWREPGHQDCALEHIDLLLSRIERALEMFIEPHYACNRMRRGWTRMRAPAPRRLRPNGAARMNAPERRQVISRAAPQEISGSDGATGAVLDAVDRAIVNRLQGGFPVSERPYAEVAARLGLTEEELLARLERLLAEGVLSRFGPMYHAERLGGALTLAAMRVPPERFDAVAAAVNAFPEVAHNYARKHAFNMWFVLATETPERVAEVIREIEQATGCRVYNLPKLEEFYVGLRFEA